MTGSQGRAWGLVSAVFALAAGGAFAAGLRVPLSVQESAGVARRAAPISGGVPLPKGASKVGQPFALFRQGGGVVPCQVSPLVVETDGTLRWVLLDFQDDVAAGATNRYELREVSPSVRCARPLSVSDEAESLTVDTGKVRFTIAKRQPFGLFTSIVAGGRPAVTGGEVRYVQLHGRKGWDDASPWQERTLVAGPPESVTLWYAGPLRVTVEVAGRFADDPMRAAYRAWITAWAGSSRVHVKHKLCNSNPDQYTAIAVRRSAIELRLASPAEHVLLGAAQPDAFEREGWLHQGLLLHHTYQDIAGAVKAGSGEKTLWTGSGPKDKPGGWLAASGATTLFVCDRLFASAPARRLFAGGQRLVLEGIAERFDGPKDAKFRQDRRVGQPYLADAFWLYDCSHHSSEYLLDFAAAESPESLDDLAKASRNRLWAVAPGQHYSDCEVLGTTRFGTQADELACYAQWGWAHKANRVPARGQPAPDAFVPAEDNHGESEADSVQGLLLMWLRTGQRGWLDLAEAWARYHTDLQAWRTDGWRWKDGGIWFPSGGPQGNRRVRAEWSFEWGAPWGKRKGSRDCTDLWRHAMSKSCYCHFYGSGLADWFCLTGDRDALAAAIDNVEQKDDEYRHYQQFVPGTSAIGSIRGFGRGFEVMGRVLDADPGNGYIADLCHLCARTLWQSPLLDERGFHCSRIGGGFGGMRTRLFTPAIRTWMDERGITFTTAGDTVDTLRKGERSWKVRCFGGTWQHVYIQNGAELYARRFGDEDMADFTIAFAQMSAKFMLSPKCHQTWYYTYFDVPDLGRVFDPWVFDHAHTTDGEGCQHSGWYTRFYPDACAKGYALTGERHLLDRGKEFWHYGSKRGYRTPGLLRRGRVPKDGKIDWDALESLRAAAAAVGRMATHDPPKDDTVLETARLFYEFSHPRRDAQPPATVTALAVQLLGDGKAEVDFTAPADAGGGTVVRYQVKVATLPILPYEQWDSARDAGSKRNWWRAINCEGEPAPSEPGSAERFVVTGVPDGRPLYFAVRSFDDSDNRSAMSPLAPIR